MTPCEFSELVRRKEIDEYQKDVRTAQITCVLANQNRKKGQKAYKITDFMPKRDIGVAQKRKQTVEEQIAIARSVTLAFGGKVSPRLLQPPLQVVTN